MANTNVPKVPKPNDGLRGTPKPVNPPKPAPPKVGEMTEDKAKYLYDRLKGTRPTPGGGITRPSFVGTMMEANKPENKDKLKVLNKLNESLKREDVENAKKQERARKQKFLDEHEHGKYLNELSRARDIDLVPLNKYLKGKKLNQFNEVNPMTGIGLVDIYEGLTPRSQRGFMNKLLTTYGDINSLVDARQKIEAEEAEAEAKRIKKLQEAEIKRTERARKAELLREAKKYSGPLGVSNEDIVSQIEREGREVSSHNLNRALVRKRLNEEIRDRAQGMQGPSDANPDSRYEDKETVKAIKKNKLDELKAEEDAKRAEEESRRIEAERQRALQAYFGRSGNYNHIFNYGDPKRKLFNNVEIKDIPEEVRRLYGFKD